MKQLMWGVFVGGAVGLTALAQAGDLKGIKRIGEQRYYKDKTYADAVLPVIRSGPGKGYHAFYSTMAYDFIVDDNGQAWVNIKNTRRRTVGGRLYFGGFAHTHGQKDSRKARRLPIASFTATAPQDKKVIASQRGSVVLQGQLKDGFDFYVVYKLKPASIELRGSFAGDAPGRTQFELLTRIPKSHRRGDTVSIAAIKKELSDCSLTMKETRRAEKGNKLKTVVEKRSYDEGFNFKGTLEYVTLKNHWEGRTVTFTANKDAAATFKGWTYSGTAPYDGFLLKWYLPRDKRVDKSPAGAVTLSIK
jgi:hypothetical protein